MRIISGYLKRRVLISPRDKTTRPFPDRMKESLFNLLRGHTEDVNVLDLFSGTGTIGFEAISRGAKHVLFVERDRETARRIHENAESLDVIDQIDIYTGDALGPALLPRIQQTPIHLIFFDPPYPMFYDPDGIPALISQMERLSSCLTEDGYLIVRTELPFDAKMEPDDKNGMKPVPILDCPLQELTPSGLIGPETHTYKSMALHFYQRA